MTTDDELRRMTTGDLHRHDAPVTLVDYDPAWADLDAREAARERGRKSEVVHEIMSRAGS